jgi:hypothetical protein
MCITDLPDDSIGNSDYSKYDAKSSRKISKLLIGKDVEGGTCGLIRGAIATVSRDAEIKSQSRQEVLGPTVFTLDHSNRTQ